MKIVVWNVSYAELGIRKKLRNCVIFDCEERGCWGKAELGG